jgi:hypothetical protein
MTLTDFVAQAPEWRNIYSNAIRRENAGEENKTYLLFSFPVFS